MLDTAKKITVYLSGPMYLGRAQATGWRNEIKACFNSWYEEETAYRGGHSGWPPPRAFNANYIYFNVLDPCDRWFGDRASDLSEVGGYIVQMDKLEVAKSDVIIVNATDPGWGTPMEQYYAWAETKAMVLAFADKDYPSIWAKAHCHQMFRTHQEAAKFLCSIAYSLARVV